MNLKKGLQTASATILANNSTTGVLPAPGFELISVKPSSASTESSPRHRSSASLCGLSTPESTIALRESQQALDNLFGRGETINKHSRLPNGHRAMGRFLEFPEVLVVPGPEADLPAPDYDKAVADAKKQDDVKTIFFVNFPLELQGDELKQQQELQKSVQSWQAWSSTMCEGKVQQQVDTKALPSDKSGEFARSTYRAKVFDYIFRKSTW